MKITKLLLLASIGISAVGCTELRTGKNMYGSEPLDPEKKSLEWCQENYTSAAVGARDRQWNARYCDTQARRAFNEAQKSNRERD